MYIHLNNLLLFDGTDKNDHDRNDRDRNDRDQNDETSLPTKMTATVMSPTLMTATKMTGHEKYPMSRYLDDNSLFWVMSPKKKKNLVM